MNEFLLRSATLDDVEHLLHQRYAMFLEMGFSQDDVRPAVAAARTYLTHALPAGSCHAWLALHEQQIIGGGFLVINDWPGVPGCVGPQYPWILNVYVEPEFRRRGVARLLMNQMIEYCRNAGFPFVALHPSADGKPLYEKLGFVPTDEMRLYFKTWQTPS
jgi:GNAT superfamily N-acetyltransferase